MVLLPRTTLSSLYDIGRTLAMVVGVLNGLGCASLHKDAISEEVISARQMSLRGFDSLERGKLEDAETWFANAIKTNPVDERAHVQYAELLWRRGLHEDAIKHLEQSVKLSGGDPALVVRLGEMYLAQGDAERAWQQADRAIQANRQLACAWACEATCGGMRENCKRRWRNTIAVCRSRDIARTYNSRWHQYIVSRIVPAEPCRHSTLWPNIIHPTRCRRNCCWSKDLP